MSGSSVLVFVTGMAMMFTLLYFAMAYSPNDSIPNPTISQDEALRIADSDLSQKLADYKGIVGIIDLSFSRYVPIAEFEQNQLEVPLWYAYPNGTVLLLSETGIEKRGECDSGLTAHCGWYDKYNFDYGSRLVYGAELKIDSDERVLVMYMIDATNGRIVDSTFLRSDWIRAHTADES